MNNRILFRKAEKKIRDFLTENNDKVLIVSGARQVGKSFLVRKVGKKLFKNFIEINLVEDFAGEKRFEGVKTKEDLALQDFA